jgi:hypothetical protein
MLEIRWYNKGVNLIKRFRPDMVNLGEDSDQRKPSSLPRPGPEGWLVGVDPEEDAWMYFISESHEMIERINKRK